MFADIWNQFSFADSTTQSNDQSADCISQLPQIAEPIIIHLVETSQNCLKYCIIQFITCSRDPQMIELILKGHLKPRDLVAYFLIEHDFFWGSWLYDGILEIHWGQMRSISGFECQSEIIYRFGEKCCNSWLNRLRKYFLDSNKVWISPSWMFVNVHTNVLIKDFLRSGFSSSKFHLELPKHIKRSSTWLRREWFVWGCYNWCVFNSNQIRLI